MISLPRSFALAFAQLSDPRVLGLLVKSALITLVLVAAIGAGGFALISGSLSRFAEGMPFVEAAGAVIALVLAALSMWLVWRLVAMAVLQYFADDVIAAVEDRYYPGLAPRDVPMAQQVRQASRGALRALIANLVALPVALALLVTGVGTAILFAIVNGWLLGRELQDMVWLRHAPADAKAPLSWLTRFLLGLAVVGLLTVPFLNLLAPFLGAAAATHLIHRAAAQQGTVR